MYGQDPDILRPILSGMGMSPELGVRSVIANSRQVVCCEECATIGVILELDDGGVVPLEEYSATIDNGAIELG